EEAAGTRRLQLRREEALHRLKSAEVELIRVNDILREIGPRVEALRDQAAKWNEYETIRNELRRRALRWYKASFGTTADQRADLTTKIVGVDKEIERLTDYVAEGESATAGTSPKRGPLASRPSARTSSERATSCASATKSDHSSRAMRSSRRLPRPSRRSGANASANVAASPRTSRAPARRSRRTRAQPRVRPS